jgi:hypothetical protein
MKCLLFREAYAVILRLLEAQRREMEAFLESEEADKDSKNEI